MYNCISFVSDIWNLLLLVFSARNIHSSTYVLFQGSYNISVVTSLYIVSHLLQVVGGKHLINAVAGLLLYHYITSSQGDATNGDIAGSTSDRSALLCSLNDINIKESSGPGAEDAEDVNINYLLEHLNKHTTSNSHFDGTPRKDNMCIERLVCFLFWCHIWSWQN